MSSDKLLTIRCGQCGSYVSVEQALRGPYAPDERRPPSVLDEPDVAAKVNPEYSLATWQARVEALVRQREERDNELSELRAIIAQQREELNILRRDRQGFNQRDRLLCDRIKKAEARIAELEAEDRPTLIGQRNAWQRIATELHNILKNKD